MKLLPRRTGTLRSLFHEEITGVERVGNESGPSRPSRAFECDEFAYRQWGSIECVCGGRGCEKRKRREERLWSSAHYKNHGKSRKREKNISPITTQI